MNGIYPFSVLTVSAREAKFPPPFQVSTKLNGVAVNFQHDTGAAVTVISKKIWHAIGKPKIHPSKIQLQSYNKMIPVIGQSKVLVQVEKQIKQQWIIVVPKGDSIFGRNWIKSFNVPLQEACNRVEGREANVKAIYKQTSVNFFSRDTRLAEDDGGSSSYMPNKIAAETAVHAPMQGKENERAAEDCKRQRKNRFLKQKTGEKVSLDTVLKNLKLQKAKQSKADNDCDWRNLLKAKARETSQVKETFEARRVFKKDTVSNSDSLSLREGAMNKRK
uniref:Peptidase A2 domain-containing protein n=1 Tax=Panagrolaimus davidi TaxID=227884 RepID=A0A914R0Y2_9BILA